MVFGHAGGKRSVCREGKGIMSKIVRMLAVVGLTLALGVGVPVLYSGPAAWACDPCPEPPPDDGD